MSRYKDHFNWTELEDEILIQAVKEAPNTYAGLRNAAAVLGTTFHVCRNRWYRDMPKDKRESIVATANRPNNKKTSNKKTTKKKSSSKKSTKSRKVSTPKTVQNQQDEIVIRVRDSLDGLLNDLTKLVEENKKLAEKNAQLERENKELTQENKELKESYEYVLKIIDRARRITLEEELNSEGLKYVIKDGVVEIAG